MFCNGREKRGTKKEIEPLKKDKMSKIVFDSGIFPRQKVKITLYREDGTVEQEQQYNATEYGNCIVILTEDS